MSGTSVRKFTLNRHRKTDFSPLLRSYFKPQRVAPKNTVNLVPSHCNQMYFDIETGKRPHIVNTKQLKSQHSKNEHL